MRSSACSPTTAGATTSAPPAASSPRTLRELLAPDVRIEVPMAARFLDEEEELITLTHRQAELLSRLGRNPRMLVRGCAGSGKTMLAVEQAKRFARDGRESLFVCFNRALRDHLREREGRSGVTFHTFHGLCTALAGQAGDQVAEHERARPAPELLARGTSAQPDRGDREAGSAVRRAGRRRGPGPVRGLVGSTVQCLSANPTSDPVWLFMDDNQDVYDIKLDPPEGFMRYDLDANCRNTQADRARGPQEVQGRGRARDPRARRSRRRADPHRRPARRASQRRSSACATRRRFRPQDIVVLSSHGMGNSEVANAGAGRFKYTREYKPTGKYVRFSSIRGFKGLESPVVDPLRARGSRRRDDGRQLYVGISRAKNHCVIVAPPSPTD